MLLCSRSSVRLVAGSLALSLPLAAAAGCGVEKKRTVKQEFQSAQTNLSKSSSASFVLTFTDPKSTFKKLLTTGDDPATGSTANDLLSGSVEFDIDPTSSNTLASLEAHQDGETSTAAVQAQLKKVNLALAVRTGKDTIGELRVVGGVLYGMVDLKEVGTLAKDDGTDDFDKQLDDTVDNADPSSAPALKDVRAGKWLMLDLNKELPKFEDLAKQFTGQAGVTPAPSASPFDAKGLGNSLYAAVKPDVKVTAANDDPDHRVLNVDVNAQAAIKAVLAVLKTEKGLPFGSILGDVMPADVDKEVLAGTGHGTVTIARGHLTQVSLDLESARRLVNDDEAEKADLSGSTVELDVDDSASEVTAPDAGDVSSFDVGGLIDTFLKGVTGETGTLGTAFAG